MIAADRKQSKIPGKVGSFSYTEVLEIELSKALAGQTMPQQALDTVAAEWNRLTDEFGREQQLTAYRASMGLPRK